MSTECQKDRKTGGQTSGQTDRQTDRHTDRKTDRLFSLVIKTKVFQNVNRMSKRQSDRKEDIQSAGQTDRVTERQNDSMADSRAAKEPALVSLLLGYDLFFLVAPETSRGWQEELHTQFVQRMVTKDVVAIKWLPVGIA